MYDLGKSLTKACKYPVFAMLAGFVLKFLEMTIAGLAVQFPEGVDALAKPELALAVGVVVLVYDWLKHSAGIRLP